MSTYLHWFTCTYQYFASISCFHSFSIYDKPRISSIFCRCSSALCQFHICVIVFLPDSHCLSHCLSPRLPLSFHCLSPGVPLFSKVRYRALSLSACVFTGVEYRQSISGRRLLRTSRRCSRIRCHDSHDPIRHRCDDPVSAAAAAGKTAETHSRTWFLYRDTQPKVTMHFAYTVQFTRLLSRHCTWEWTRLHL